MTGPVTFDSGFTLAPAAVPEPASMTMLGIGALSLIGYGLRRRRAKVAAA